MSFDGYGPEHNETIKSLRKATERALNCLKYVYHLYIVSMLF